MANHDRWLKPVPSPSNVSQSDVARIAREKRERQERESQAQPEPKPAQTITSPSETNKASAENAEARAPRTPPTPRRTRTPPTPPTTIAPERDYAKVANSIVRDAVAGGYFIGKSKQLYDFLYSRTRGAITPVRNIRITKPKLMSGSGIGSERTLLKNINHLKSIGLIEVNITDGGHGGNEYTVHLPEEIDLPPTPPTPPTPRTAVDVPHALQKVGYVPPVESGVRGVGLKPEDATTSRDAKTSFKTIEIDDDDEAFASSARAMKKLIEAVTGREATASECSKMVEVIEVLTLEAKIAAARTAVSSAGPFLAEHLRRRLFKKNKQEMAIEMAQSEPVAASVDVSQCPDCAGVGWYYPEGKEKGMAKCKHPRLSEDNNQVAG